MLTRQQLITTKCWSCWWREGGHCFNAAFGPIPEDKRGFRIGFKIDGTRQCIYYKSKRSVLEPYFGDKLVILSEEAVICDSDDSVGDAQE